MNEACKNLLNRIRFDHSRGQAFAIKTLNYMRDVIKDIQNETGHYYNLEATPAEAPATALPGRTRPAIPILLPPETRSPTIPTPPSCLWAIQTISLKLELQDEQSLYQAERCFIYI